MRFLGCALLATCVTAIGCRPSEQIEAYNVPKEAPARAAPAAAVAATTEATDRMLAAILPDGDRAWFFKVTGPVREMTAQATEIGRFLSTVQPAPGKPHPDWQLPAGWQEQPAAGMRAATLLIPGETKPLELSVTVLPWSGRAGELLGNVNRWRGQLQLAPTDEKGLAECTQDIKVGDTTMTVVDLTGRMTGGMTPPFAGGPMTSTPPVAAAPPTNDARDLPPGHPALGGQ